MNESFLEDNKFETWRSISNETIDSWVSQENLENRNKRVFQGFEITDSIDGGLDSNTEVSLVKITAKDQYPQHIHKNSDAYFIIVAGEAVFLSADTKKVVRVGDRIDIPKGTPHGFDFDDKGILEFVSIQSPPIRNKDDNSEDLHLFDQI